MSSKRKLLVTRNDNARLIELHLRDRMEVRLPESQISGYMWQVKEKDCPQIRLEDSEYMERGAARFTGLGERSWYFSCMATGRCRLTFYLIRPWSKPSPEFYVDLYIE